MIKVNLIAMTPGAAPAREWFPREQRSALIGLGLLALTAVGIGGYWYYLSGVRAAVDAKIATAETTMARLKIAAELVKKTSARKTELTERLGVIDRLRAGKREPANLLENLSRNLPDGLWLLEVKQTASTVQVDGRAMSITAVTDFTEQLQNSGMFLRPVEILTTSTETVEETTVVKFTVKADIVPIAPAPSVLAPAGAPNAVAGTAPKGSGV